MRSFVEMTFSGTPAQLLVQTILAVGLVIGHTTSVVALERQKATAPCNLARALAPARQWMMHPDIAVFLISLTRTPAMMTRLTWGYCNDSASPIEINAWRDLGAIDQGAQLVRLSDNASGKTYSPILLEGFAYGSLIPNKVELMPGEAFTVWMNFPDLPMTIDHVDIRVDDVGIFSAVPIE